ncbi:MAG: phosphatidylserine/phosphatidylglycerophosphate/cardiolipin synthase family protein [Bacteroidales bacterium]|nr:phosphatidylserine/phosphatidylglycerophosphate/cardiolipin synthase family protein [Bacteroidales bacterium]
MTKYFLIPALLLLPLGALAEELEDAVVGASTLPPFPDDVTSDTILRSTLERELGVEFTENNSVVLLHTGKAKFNAMFSAIRQARHYVHLEYFNFRNDSIGLALFQLLGEKAKQGVEVRAMFDSFGNSSNDSPLKNRHLRAIRAMGIQVEEFDPIKFPWINHAYHRDHRKIVVIDGAVCYAGGMNVADYYINGRPEYGEWRDMHMELTGDVVGQYQRLFARMWWQQTGEVLLDERYCASKNADALSGEVFENVVPMVRSREEFQLLKDSSSTAGHKVIGVVDRRPRYTPKHMRQAYVTAIDAAKEHIQIVNPYPTNVKSVRRALRRALERGVRVEIMVSAKSDVPITPDVVALEMKHLAKRGAEVYYNQTGFHHSKVMMVDGRFCTIGSTNLDGRSFLFDYEVNSFILDLETTKQLQDLFEQDKHHCKRFYAEDYARQFSLSHRAIGRLFSLVRGFF